MRRAAKIDGNHAAIVEALRAAGWHFHSTASLPGFVDGIAARRGRLELVEIKTPKGKLRPAQERLHADLLRSGVIVKVLRDIQDAVRL